MAIACIPWGAYDSAGSTTTTGSNTTAQMAADLAANGFDALVLGNHSLYNHEYGHPNAFYPAIRAVAPDLGIIVQESGKWSTTDPPDSWANGWYGSNSHPFDEVTARQFAQQSLTYWAGKKGFLGRITSDDVTDYGAFGTVGQQTAQKSEWLVRVCQADDPSRFATATWVTPGAGGLLAGYGSAVGFSYYYPFGSKQASGGYGVGGPYVWTAEGDFHSSRMSAVASHDYADQLAWWLGQWPKDRPLLLAMQTHSTSVVGGVQTATPGSATVLRYPYASEIALYTLIALGRGVKGLFWFTYSSINTWYGWSHPSRADVRAAIIAMGQRLATPGIKEALRRSQWSPLDQPFTLSGGGEPTNSYASGFLSALHDPVTGEYTLIVGNYGLGAQSVTVSSATLSGSLQDLETGTTTPLGGAITLPRLNGGIYRFVPA